MVLTSETAEELTPAAEATAVDFPPPSLPAPRRRPLRVALIMLLSPNKLGSLEQWMLRFCQDAAGRGIQVDVYCEPDLLPEIAFGLRASGARWHPVAELLRRPWAARRRLAAYDLLHLNFIEVRTPLAWLAYLAYPARVLLVDHISGVPGAAPTRFLRLRGWADRLCMARLSGIVAVSDYVSARDRRRFQAPQRIRRIYNGIDLERFKPRPRAASPDLRLLAAAQLIRHKGLDLLIEAAALLDFPAWRLTIVGDGVERKALEELAAARGIAAKVDFLGVRSDMEMLLARADLFVHPARWEEAFGLVIAEAMACGLPVVAADAGAVPELVRHRFNGLLVPPEQPAALAAAITELARCPPLRLSLGRASRQRAVECFSLETCVRGHLELCEELGDKP